MHCARPNCRPSFIDNQQTRSLFDSSIHSFVRSFIHSLVGQLISPFISAHLFAGSPATEREQSERPRENSQLFTSATPSISRLLKSLVPCGSSPQWHTPISFVTATCTKCMATSETSWLEIRKNQTRARTAIPRAMPAATPTPTLPLIRSQVSSQSSSSPLRRHSQVMWPAIPP